MVTSFITEQGGVGKTSLCYNIGWYFATIGKKVLLIDLDAQGGNMTFFAGVKQREDKAGIYDIISDPRNTIANSRIKIRENLYLIPANGNTMLLGDLIRVKGQDCLKKLIDNENEYDYIFIDTNPTPSLIHYISLVASDNAIIPTLANAKSYEATKHIIDTVELVKEEMNPKLYVLAVVYNMYNNRTRISKITRERIDKLCKVKGVNVAKTRIPFNTDIDHISLVKVGITEYSKKSTGAIAILKLTSEIFHY